MVYLGLHSGSSNLNNSGGHSNDGGGSADSKPPGGNGSNGHPSVGLIRPGGGGGTDGGHHHHHAPLRPTMAGVAGGGGGGGGSDQPHVVTESSGDDDSDEREGRIRVGKDFQAHVPSLIPPDDRRPEQTPERALLVWSPAPTISNTKLDEFIQVSKEKYGYNAEQALGMLFWHKHDLDRAIQDLANFTPFPDEWTVEDKVLFEQAFQFHGKSFHRIRQMLPDKTIAQLVKYYYSWKKTRTRTSLMDRQARKLQAQRDSEATVAAVAAAAASKDAPGGEVVATVAPVIKLSDDEDDDEDGGCGAVGEEGAAGERQVGGATTTSATRCRRSALEMMIGADCSNYPSEESQKPKCFNCGILCHVTHPSPKGQMCGTCHQYYTRTGRVRPTTGPARRDGSKSRHAPFLRNGNRPPKGMYVNHDDLVALATGPTAQGEALLKSMDREIVSYKRQVQNNKQFLSTLTRHTRDRSDVAPYRLPDQSAKISARWTNEELLLGVQGVRKFGKHFRTIAEVVATKTESHVRSFFVNYRRRYNLDVALKEFEAENGPANANSEDDDEAKDCSMDQEESSASKSSPSVPATSGANGVVASK